MATKNIPVTPDIVFGKPRACSKSEDIAKLASAASNALAALENTEAPDVNEFKDVPAKYRGILMEVAGKEIQTAANTARSNAHDFHRASGLGGVQNLLKSKEWFATATPEMIRENYRITLEFVKNNPSHYTK